MRRSSFKTILRAALACTLLLSAALAQENPWDGWPPKPSRPRTVPGNRPPSVTLDAKVSAPSAAPYPRTPSRDALKWADAELKKMSLDEKVGQLVSVGVNARFLNRQSDEFKELRRQVEQNHVGGIILFRGPVYESAHLVNRMQQFAKLPLL